MNLTKAKGIAAEHGYTLEFMDIEQERRTISYLIAIKGKKSKQNRGVDVMSASHFAMIGEQRFRRAFDTTVIGKEQVR